MLLSYRSKEYFIEIGFPVLSALFVILSMYVNTGNIFLNKDVYLGAVVMCGTSVLGITRQFVMAFGIEKAEKFKETQKIMGLKQSAYSLGWIMTNFVKGLIVTTIYLSISFAFDGFRGVNISNWTILCSYILYFISAFGQTYFFSTLFQNPQTTTDVVFFLQLLFSFFFQLQEISAFGGNYFLNLLFSFSPQFCMLAGMQSEGWNGGPRIIKKYLREINWSINDALMMQTVNIVLYFTLYFYFDQTLPNEYGTQKPHFWFFKKSKSNETNQNKQKIKNGSDLEKNLIATDENQEQNQNVKDEIQKNLISAKYQENIQSDNQKLPTVFINQLFKKYKNKIAVNKIDMTLYEGEILCLLGHNGAGKTTTISLLTGLIQKNSGKIIMYDLNLDNQLDEIRGKIGLCNQQNVLYEEMTVEEHLNFYGKFCIQNQNNLQKDIEDIIEKCLLTKERKKYINQLSGGNKRKLCLAMALIGEKKMIFLDEPSSGMDPVTRREIWGILDNLKNEKRTVILTTHHLEEAEFLASRIAVMQAGKILAVGTSDFIKKQFGIGYHLIIQKKIPQNNLQDNKKQLLNNQNLNQTEQKIENQDSIQELSQDKKNQLKNLVFEKIPNVKINPQSAKGTLFFTLPFDQVQFYPELFKILEQDKEIQLNLEMNSLEDAFINIGMDDEQEKLQSASDVNQNEQNQEKFTDFDQIEVPDCVKNKKPCYSFWGQFYPILLRKWYLITRTLAVLFSLIVPVLFQTIGVIVAKYVVIDNINMKDYAPFFQMGFLNIYNIVGYCCCASAQAGLLAEEREKKIKYSMTVMGLRSQTYFLGTFIMDYLVFCLNYVLFVLVIYIFDLKCFEDTVVEMTISFLLFAVAMIWKNYVISFFFEKGQNCFRIMFWINFIILYSIPLLITLIDSDIVHQILVILSPYVGLFQVFLFNSAQSNNVPPSLKGLMKSPFNKLWIYCVIFIFQAGISIAICLYLNNKKHNTSISQQKLIKRFDQDNNKDATVIEEENKIKQQQIQDIISVQNLYKIYNNGFQAINNITFSVKQGEIFGLLGPNGAGKSTSFNILTSMIPKTEGNVKLNGKEVNQGEYSIYEEVGITPQFDPIWESLTVKEHLQIYGGIKGLVKKELEEAIQYFLNVMQLKQYENIKAVRLSGGNKRKLCVTLAMIGSPIMQFFDEPSSGLDPIARRFLWNTLKKTQNIKNSAIVLTTHSMNEAESLCDKIGILINGQFKCIGTPSQLKQLFGQGYNVNIQLPFPVNQEDKSFITSKFCEEFHQSENISNNEQEGEENKLLFKVSYENFSFYKVYTFLQKKEILSKIKDFGIHESTLEQIFIYFSQFQKNEEIKNRELLEAQQKTLEKQNLLQQSEQQQVKNFNEPFESNQDQKSLTQKQQFSSHNTEQNYIQDIQKQGKIQNEQESEIILNL